MMNSDKASLRTYYSTLRGELSSADRRASAQLAAEQFCKHIPQTANTMIAGYYPMRDELDTLPLLTLLEKKNHTIALPCVEKNDLLVFRMWHVGEPLIPHPIYRVQQPHPESPLCIPSVLIVPLLAFDRHGHRLGYGGGFYDRTIADMRNKSSNMIAVGYGYDQQYTAHLPAESHDEPLDYGITDKQCFTF